MTRVTEDDLPRTDTYGHWMDDVAELVSATQDDSSMCRCHGTQVVTEWCCRGPDVWDCMCQGLPTGYHPCPKCGPPDWWPKDAPV